MEQGVAEGLADRRGNGSGGGKEPFVEILGAAGLCGCVVEDADAEYRKQGTAGVSAREEREADQWLDGGRYEHEADSAGTGGSEGLPERSGYEGLDGL